MAASASQLAHVVDQIKGLPPHQLHYILGKLPPDEKVVILGLLEELEVRKKRQLAQDNFMEFVHEVWPAFIEGNHHIRIARLFERIASGELKRLIINLPPRHTKSEFASYLFPAWFLGKFPHKKIIQASHTAELAVSFGRKVRNLVDSEIYHNIFPSVELQTDSKAAGRWNTNFAGDYNAIGVGGAMAGKGADLCVDSTTNIITKAGRREAQDVSVGDYVLTEHGFKKVTHKVRTVHKDTYCINRVLKVSHNHPIYVFNKGFVRAEELNIGDILYTMSIWDKLVSSIMIGVHNAQSILEEQSKIFCLHKSVQHMGHDAAAVYKPQCSELYELWRSWYRSLRTVGPLSEFYRRYGGTSIERAHTGSGKQRGTLRTWELSVGHRGRTTEQAEEQRFYNRPRGDVNSSPMVQENRTDYRHNTTSNISHEDGSGGGVQSKTNELGPTGRYQESLGWLRNRLVQVLGRCQEGAWEFGQHMELFVRTVEECLGFLVGVRRVRSVDITESTYGEFYNFTVDDTHTFIADTYLTHNCILDDPISEQDAMAGMHNPAVHDKIYEWYTSGPRQRLQPGAAILIVQCVEENQRVLLSNGVWKPIRDIQIGEEVATYRDNRPTPQRVINIINQGEDDLLEIVSGSCTVKVNARHPFLVVEGGLDISPKTQEDVVKSRSWGLVWKTAGELEPRDMVVTIKSLGNSIVNGHRPARMGSPRQFTQDEYWLFGYLFGDGWLINSGKRGIVGFCIAASNHLDVDQYVIGLVKKYFGIDMVLTNYGYYRADNLERGRWLGKKGFCSGAKVKRVPEWVFKLRPCDKREFLRGFFVADGWLRPAVRKVETYHVGLANRELLDDLRLLSRTCGVRTTKIYEEIVECQPPHSPKPIIAINYRARFSIKNNDLENNWRYKHQSPNGNGVQYFRFERVETIKPMGRGIVYDLTVEGSENFIAEGFVVHNTRWSQKDLTAQVLRSAAMRNSNEWTVVEFPAILPSGKSLWPEFWPIEALEATKAELPTYQWNAQYQQNPTGDASAIIKREWWQWWEETKPPKCDFIIQAWDTAHETKTVNDYSACTTWGVWYNDEDKGLPNIILLNAFRKRLEFPELKKVAFDEWKDWEPDSFLVEKKAAGAPLIQEFRAMGISVQEFSPGKGQDKISRLNAVSDIFASKKVWVPRTRWAEEVVDEVASFPSGEHDDLTDSMTLALSRFRQGGYMRLPSDEPDPQQYFKSNRHAAYY